MLFIRLRLKMRRSQKIYCFMPFIGRFRWSKTMGRVSAKAMALWRWQIKRKRLTQSTHWAITNLVTAQFRHVNYFFRFFWNESINCGVFLGCVQFTAAGIALGQQFASLIWWWQIQIDWLVSLHYINLIKMLFLPFSQCSSIVFASFLIIIITTEMNGNNTNSILTIFIESISQRMFFLSSFCKILLFLNGQFPFLSLHPIGWFWFEIFYRFQGGVN